MNKNFCWLLNTSIAHSNQLRGEKSKSYKEIKRMEKRRKNKKKWRKREKRKENRQKRERKKNLACALEKTTHRPKILKGGGGRSQTLVYKNIMHTFSTYIKYVPCTLELTSLDLTPCCFNSRLPNLKKGNWAFIYKLCVDDWG